MPNPLRVPWKDRDARLPFPADPSYPSGTDLDLSWVPSSVVDVAARVGAHVIECSVLVCDCSVAPRAAPTIPERQRSHVADRHHPP
jgi:hypothetical protein